MLNIFKKKKLESKESTEQLKQIFECKICGMEFNDKNRFLKHKEKAHPRGR